MSPSVKMLYDLEITELKERVKKGIKEGRRISREYLQQIY